MVLPLLTTKLNNLYLLEKPKVGSSLSGLKGGSRHKNLCMSRALSFLIRYFSNYYTLHRSVLAARAAPLDPRLGLPVFPTLNNFFSYQEFDCARARPLKYK